MIALSDQHLAIMVFRAAENRFVLRSANSGISSFYYAERRDI